MKSQHSCAHSIKVDLNRERDEVRATREEDEEKNKNIHIDVRKTM